MADPSGQPPLPGAGEPGAGRDQLGALRDRLSAAEDAVRAAAGGVPPAGWDVPRERGPAAPPDLTALVAAALEASRELVPPELRRQLADAVTELLRAVRALIDLLLERLDDAPPTPVEVEDIPIA